MNRPTLSIIVPVFNEAQTIQAILERLADGPYPHQEVIVVDDGSSDGTSQILDGWACRPGFLLLRHAHNQGKGAAVRTGLGRATGRVAVIQDADLEYDPDDLPKLVDPILQGECEAVYGSRYLRAEKPLPWTLFRVAVHLMNGIVRLLYGVRLTDVNTCYKVLRTELYQSLHLRCERFEFCAEVTGKLCRRGIRILEIPIRYHPRSRAEGKKIGLRDAWEFAATLLRWRFARLPSSAPPRSIPTAQPPAGPCEVIDSPATQVERV